MRAPTNRGELAQRAAGLHPRSLVPPRPSEPAIPVGVAPPAPPALTGAGLAPPAPRPSPDMGPAPTWAAPEAFSGPAVTPGPSGWAAHAPVPGAYAAATEVTGVLNQVPPADVTEVYPTTISPVVHERHPGADGARAGSVVPSRAGNEEPGDEPRSRPGRPGVEAPWPPPPGPWSGRRTSES